MKQIVLNLAVVIAICLFINACGSSSQDENQNKENANTKITKIEDVWQMKDLKTLEKNFGKENLLMGETSYDEGYSIIKTTTIYPNSDYPLIVVWDSFDKDFTQMYSIKLTTLHFDDEFNQIKINTNYWQCANGLRLGMTIGELREWAESPFKFYGLDWDYSGLIDQQSNSKFDKYAVYLGCDVVDYDKLPKDYYKITGDILIDSDNKIANDLQIYVNTIEYSPLD